MTIRLTLKLSPEDAERLYWAYHSGELDVLGATDFQYAENQTMTVETLERAQAIIAEAEPGMFVAVYEYRNVYVPHKKLYSVEHWTNAGTTLASGYVIQPRLIWSPKTGWLDSYAPHEGDKDAKEEGVGETGKDTKASAVEGTVENDVLHEERTEESDGGA